MKKLLVFNLMVLALVQMGCKQEETAHLDRSDFGKLDNKQVYLYDLGFDGGLQAKVTNYGGIITGISVPDKDGKIERVTLGYDSLDDYLAGSPYFGALIGRYGNRIAKGKFSLNGKDYTLAVNNGENALHGGLKGFDKVVWDVLETKKSNDSISIKLQYKSADMEEGYPGNLNTVVTYTFTKNSVSIAYWAQTDAPTVLNLTNHSYFNLSGDVKHDILDHKVTLMASHFLPVDSTLIPTGEIRAVKGTPFDFTAPKVVGKDIGVDNTQLTFGLGYDHCWVLDGGQTASPRKVAEVYHPDSHRDMEVYTDQPAIQFYTGNFLDGTNIGSGGVTYKHRYALCLETQHYPDSPNQPSFPSVVLNPGETYSTKTIYKFSVKP